MALPTPESLRTNGGDVPAFFLLVRSEKEVREDVAQGKIY